MEEIKLNGKTYILKSSIKTDSDLKKEVEKLKNKNNELREKNNAIRWKTAHLTNQLEKKNDDILNNKYKKKCDELSKNYRNLYLQYKTQCNRNIKQRQKYIEIIHQLQCEIINQASIEDLLKEVERMSEIETQI